MGTKLRSIIVDDENFARENLRILLEDNCPEVEVIGMAESVEEARTLIDEVSPEVIFLDIRMPSGSEGFDLLDSIPDKKFQVVFVTAFNEYAMRAINANAIHYILKPIDIDDLKTAVSKLMESREILKADTANYSEYVNSLENLLESLKSELPIQRITIRHAKGFKIVEDKDIVSLEADGNCTILHFSNGTKYLDTRTLKVYEEILEPRKFCRIHKSFIINIYYLKEYLVENGHQAILKDGSKLPISRGRLNDFLDLIKKI